MSKTRRKALSFIPYPFYGKSDLEKQRRRKKRVDFLKLKRAHWEPTEHSAVCSEHFKEQDLTKQFFLEDLDRGLKRDEIGVSVSPKSMPTLFQLTKRLKDLKVSKVKYLSTTCSRLTGQHKQRCSLVDCEFFFDVLFIK